MRQETNCMRLHLYGNRLLGNEAKDDLQPAAPFIMATGCTGMELRQRMNCIQLHPLYGNRHAQPSHQQLSFSDKVAGTGIRSRISP